jgi:hypothetical protein
MPGFEGDGEYCEGKLEHIYIIFDFFFSLESLTFLALK